MNCSSEPGVIAAGAGALPGARRRCEAGTRTYGRATRTCLALLAATALLALAAPAQAQTTTVTQSGEGATWSLVGENTVAAGQQTYTYTLTRTSGSQPQNEYFGFTSDTLEAERFQDGYSDCTGTNYFCFTLSNSFSYSEYTVSNVRFAGRILRDTSTQHVLTLKVATGTPTGTTVTLGVVSRSGIPRSGGLLITVGAATTNTAAMGAPTITGTAQVGKTLTAVITGITDADGLTSATYTYQWIRVDGTDEEDISGENSSTYTLVDADLGKTIKVKVSFTDDASNSETLTSAATATVAADTTPPEVVSVTVASTGSDVYLVFDEGLDGTAGAALPSSAFSLTVAGQAVTIHNYNFHEAEMTLTVQSGTIKQGQTVVVSYTDPTAGDDTVALQDIAGNDVASFTTDMSGVPAVTNDSTVAGTNTAPTAAHNTVTTGEDRPYAFTADDFGFMDADTGAALASVKIVTVPLLGTLALDGTAVLADAVVTEAQIDGDMLTFTPAQDAHGDPYTTFTFKVNDGTVDSAIAYTMTIDVTDAPPPVCAVPDIAGDGRRQTLDRHGDGGGARKLRKYFWLRLYWCWNARRQPCGRYLLHRFERLYGRRSLCLYCRPLQQSKRAVVQPDRHQRQRQPDDGGNGGAACMSAIRASTSSAVAVYFTSAFPLGRNSDWSDPVVTRTVYLSLPANNDATGEPTISGTARAEQVLTADASPIMDTDGLPSSFTYKWFRVDSDGTSNEEDITGETAATYTLTTADVGKKVKVKVSFTDQLSGEEERTSAAYPSSGTVTVAGPNTAPTAANNTVTTGEDRAYAFTADDFGFDDADAGDTLASVTIVTVPLAGHPGARRHGGPGGRRRHRGPDRRRHAHLHARARCARRPLYDLHLHGERRHGRQRHRLHDDHRRDGRPRPRLRGARYRRRRPAPDLDRHGDGGGVLVHGKCYWLRIRWSASRRHAIAQSELLHRFEQLRDRRDHGFALREPALFP